MKSIAVIAVLLSAALAQAKTIQCTGLSPQGEKVSLSVVMDQTLKTTINIQAGDYANSWDADQMTFDQRNGEAILTASSGDRSEYYIQLRVSGSKAASSTLSYDENDSGWEFSIESRQLTCN